MDLRFEYPGGIHSLTLSILTLMFIPVEYRQKILREAFNHLEPGGAFILVEKVLGHGAMLQDMMSDLYHTHKHKQGYSDASIRQKRFALEGVLVPLQAEENQRMLYDAGFSTVDCFWRWLNFAGWCAVK